MRKTAVNPPQKTNVTSKDVARLAGVSQPTVSRAFTPEASISPETREKVMAAAAKLGYKPNAISRSLITQQTNIVGVVMANLSNSLFYTGVIEQLTQRLQSMGQQALLFTASPSQPVDEILPNLLQYRVRGLVVASSTPSHEVQEECARLGTPVVLLNRFDKQNLAYSVCCDNVAGAHAVADALVAGKHERFGYIAGIAATATNRMRLEGFRKGLAAHGIHDIAMAQGHYTYESGYAAAIELLTQPDRPDAIFCAADIMALGALDAARGELGLSVPDDVSIIGFDDIPVSAWSAYGLTTIRQPGSEMIERTIEIILEDGGETRPLNQTTNLPGTLIWRSSAKKPAQR